MTLDLHLRDQRAWANRPARARRSSAGSKPPCAWPSAEETAKSRSASSTPTRPHLNRQYRHRDHATERAFPVGLEPGIKLPLLGDLAICAPVVAREAREQGKPLRDHYAHMTVHGILHLLGHDHENDVDAERMENLERKILAELGFADPYVER
jgi:rRNA maturation RNase YbeY